MNSGSFDGGLLNLTNWVGNEILPTIAVLILIMGIYTYSKNGNIERYIIGAMASLGVSGLLRLSEAFMQQGSGADQYYTAILTLVNWVGNVILPAYAGLEIARAFIASHTTSQLRAKEQWVRHLVTAIGCLSVSAITRLLEYFIQNGTQVGGG